MAHFTSLLSVTLSRDFKTLGNTSYCRPVYTNASLTRLSKRVAVATVEVISKQVLAISVSIECVSTRVNIATHVFRFTENIPFDVCNNIGKYQNNLSHLPAEIDAFVDIYLCDLVDGTRRTSND